MTGRPAPVEPRPAGPVEALGARPAHRPAPGGRGVSRAPTRARPSPSRWPEPRGPHPAGGGAGASLSTGGRGTSRSGRDIGPKPDGRGSGAGAGIRTPDPGLKRPLLSLAELRRPALTFWPVTIARTGLDYDRLP